MPENSYINTHPKTFNPKKKPRASKALRSGNHGIRGQRRRSH
jgi:hypothetical protein